MIYRAKFAVFPLFAEASPRRPAAVALAETSETPAQLTAFFTSAAILASSAAVSSFSAK
jgi:hypothetical protein